MLPIVHRLCAVGLSVALVFVAPASLRRVPAAAAEAPGTSALLQPIDRLIRGSDAGYAREISVAYVSAPTIVDEFAPFHWSGEGAAIRWAHGFTSVATASQLSHIHVVRHAPSYVTVMGRHAWLVVPTDYEYDAAGKPQRESAAWTFVLYYAAGGWRIEASTWAKTAGAA
jgi:hypothetical protein